jgi:hypothetical protein
LFSKLGNLTSAAHIELCIDMIEKMFNNLEHVEKWDGVPEVWGFTV